MPGYVVNQVCRHKYCHPHQIARHQPRRALSRLIASFVVEQLNLGKKYDVLEVKTIGIKETFKNMPRKS